VWDNAAGVLLVRSAGGVVTDLDGNTWGPRSHGVIAGTPLVHHALMSTIEQSG
jgi:inositol-phosphate phosphatase